MNKITLIGNVGKSPEMQYLADGKAVTKFSLAVNRRFKNKQGEKCEETTWFNCVAWEGIGETINQYVEKGNKIAISGRMVCRRYTDKDNVERDSWNVQVDEMELLTPKPNSTNKDSTPPDDEDFPF
jgi:single-strand DNA-binding protein